MFFLSGVARFLFVPLAEAVVFAMIASYILSRTLVPTLVHAADEHAARRCRGAQRAAPLQRLYRAFDRRFERMRARLHAGARRAARRSGAAFALLFLGFCVLSCLLYPVLGRDFFPSVDAGQIRLHMRAPTGTRIEETARLADAVEAAIRELDPAGAARDDPRQPRRAQQRHQPLATATPAPSARSTARSCCRCARATGPPTSFVTPLRAELPQALSRHRVLLPAGRHRHADPQLRPAGGDRRAVHRRQPGRQRRARRRAAQVDPHDSRRGRRARAPAARRARRSTCRWTARACSSSA